MIRKFLPVMGIAIMGMYLGCNKSVVSYNDARSVETLNVDFGSTDLQLIAERMVTSLISSNKLKVDPADPNKPPLVCVVGLKNDTSEHIDTKSITDKIRTALIRSGKVRFSALEAQKALIDQYILQNDLADSKTKKRAGQQVGCKYILSGNISSIVKEVGRVKDVYYKITLQVTDVESAVIDWADEFEIRKDRTKSIFGL